MNFITIRELIAELQKMPQDAKVVPTWDGGIMETGIKIVYKNKEEGGYYYLDFGGIFIGKP